MVAVVTGNGQGLANGSLGVLGNQGAVGNALQGQLGEGLYVNGASGNLVVMHQDEILSGRGLDVDLTRTYNSRANADGSNWDGDNNDSWRIGIYRRVSAINAQNNTVQRTEADGSVSTFTWDSGRNAYVSRSGGGAYDTLTFDSANQKWTFIDGDSRVSEVYDASNGGRLISQSDLNGNTITYSYTGTVITQINMASSYSSKVEKITLAYSGQLLSQISTSISDDGVNTRTSTRVYYEYDESSRLKTVITDLTPDDNSKADGKIYSVAYTYYATADASNGKLKTLTQSDGSVITIGYDASGRVAGFSDGMGRITRFDYSVANQVKITDPLNAVTTLSYDSAQNLTQVKDAQGNTLTYAYDSTSDKQGNLNGVTDARSRTVNFEYDSRGNRTLERDAAGNTVSYAYTADNQIYSMTRYRVPDADGSGSGVASGAMVTRYVYDSKNQLRFEISDEGRVTEYRYNSYGQRTSVIQYVDATYITTTPDPIEEGTLTGWLAGITLRNSVRTDNTYDFRGNLKTVCQFGAIQADGSGLLSDTATSTTTFTYSASGQLLQTVDGLGRTSGFAYDGMGRLLAQMDAGGRVSLTQYDDAGMRIVGYQPNGQTVTRYYNAAGELISSQESTTQEIPAWFQTFTSNLAGLTLTANVAPGVEPAYIRWDSSGRMLVESRSGPAKSNPMAVGANTYSTRDGVTFRSEVSLSANNWQSLVLGADNNQLSSSTAFRRHAVVFNNGQIYANTATGTNSVNVSLGLAKENTTYVVEVVETRLGSTLYVYEKGTSRSDGFVHGWADSSWGVARSMLYTTVDVGRVSNVIYIDNMAEIPQTNLRTLAWQQDFSSNTTTGLDLLDNTPPVGEAAYIRTDGSGRLIFESRNATTAAYPKATGSRSYLQSTGVTVRGEVSVTSSGGQAFTLGADNGLTGAANRRHAAYFNNGTLYASLSSDTSRVLGALKENTTYVVEVVVTAGGSTLYVYERGQARDSGFIDYQSSSDWGSARSLAFTAVASGRVLNTVYLDNLSESQNVAMAPGQSIAGDTTRYFYDTLGRERMQVDATGLRTFTLYDNAGRKNGTIDSAGRLTRYTYTANGQLHQTYRFADPVPGTAFVLGGIGSLLDANGQPSALLQGTETLAGILPSFDAESGTDYEQDDWSFNLYDEAGRLAKTVDRSGYTTELMYDGAGRVVKTRRYATANTSPIANSLFAADFSSTANDTLDRVTRTFYDDDGLKRGDLDAEGYLTEYRYDSLGRLNHTIRYAQKAANASGATLADLSQGSHVDDQHSYVLYNTRSQVVADIDAEGYLTEYTYDKTGNRTQTRRYATAVWNDGGIGGLGSALRWTSNLGSDSNAGGWTSQATTPRLTGDVNGDGKDDVVGFGNTGTYVFLSTGNGLGSVLFTTATFSVADGWTSQDATPRQLADMNGDGKDDIVGFKTDGMYVALSTGSGFAAATKWSSSFGSSAAAGSWTTQTAMPRLLGDVNGDGKDDLVAINGSSTSIYLSTGSGLGSAIYTNAAFSGGAGWTSQDKQPRQLGDMNGDGKADMVGFTTDGMYVALSTGSGFDSANKWTGDLGSNLASGGWTTQNQYPRLLADVDGDGKDDVVAFGYGTVKAWHSTGSGLSGSPWSVSTFSTVDGWTAQTATPRLLADMNGDGRADIAGFGAYGLSVAEVVNLARLDYIRPPVSSRDVTSTASYDALNRVVTETATDGTKTEYTYGLGGQLQSRTVAKGAAETHSAERTTRYSYDLNGRQKTVTQAEGGTIRSSYDAAGRLTKSVQQLNSSSSAITLYYYANTFSSNNRQYSYVVDAAGYITRTALNTLGQVTETRRSARALSPTQLSSLQGKDGGLISTSFSDSLSALFDDSVDARSSTNYTVRGLVDAVRDAFGNSTTFAYNAFGEQTLRTQALADGTGRSLISSYSYDKRGSLKTRIDDDTTGGLKLKTQQNYDAFGRVISSIDASNVTRSTAYDHLGRVIQLTDSLLNKTRTLTYDAWGRVLSSKDALGAITTTAYDDVNRKVTVTSPEGVVTETLSTRHGQTLSITLKESGNNKVITYSYDRNGNLKNTVFADLTTHTDAEYDLANRLVASYDASGVAGTLGLKTTYSYDAINRVLTRTVDPTGLALTTTTAYSTTGVGQGITVTDASGVPTSYNGQVVTVTDTNGVVTQTIYDAKGQAVLIKTGGSALDATVIHISTASFDAGGHQLTVTEGADSQGLNPLKTTKYKYDVLGRRIETRVVGARSEAETGTVDLISSYHYDKNGNLIDSVDGNGQVTRRIYDTENRLKYLIDAVGAVTETFYDNAGRVISTRQYANEINIGPSFIPDAGTILLPNDISSRLTLDPANDIVRELAYDKDGRVVKSLDALRQLTHTEYDKAGNVTRVTRYATPLAANITLTASTSVAADPSDQVTRYIYDKFNRRVYTIDALNYVDRVQYDASGRVVRTTRYTVATGLGGLPSLTDMDNWASGKLGRSSAQAYDAAGRLKYTVDALNYVTETTYFSGSNQIKSTTRYVQACSTVLGTSFTASDILAGLTSSSTLDQTTKYFYDEVGRLKTQTDAEGASESWTYTRLGLKKTLTNKNGAKWDYEYDAAGRLIKEITPPVGVLTYDSAFVPSGSETSVPQYRIETTYRYDGAGNLRYRTEAANIVGQSRTTQYQYDAVGHQSATLLPTVGVDDGSKAVDDDVFGATTLDRSAAGLDSSTTPTISKQFDAFGRTVVNRDVMNVYSYVTYDRLGRLRHEVDGEGFVTEHVYDAFGNQTALIRYSQRISITPAGSPQTEAQIVALLPANDSAKRTLSSRYDANNRLTEVKEDSLYHLYGNDTTGSVSGQTFQKRTAMAYNAFNELTVNTVELNSSGTVTAKTYTYYDARGLKIGEVNAEKYLTTYGYDAFGNLTSQTEYAQRLNGTVTESSYGALPAPDTANREMASTYDRLNRKSSDTRLNSEYTTVNVRTPESETDNLSTRYEYDKAGNQIKITDAMGNITRQYYDALGRKTAIITPSFRLSSTAVQDNAVTAYAFDAFGNMTHSTRYSNKANWDDTTWIWSANTSVTDRETQYRYDAASHEISNRQEDALYASESIVSHKGYDAAGHITREWTGNKDALGNANNAVRQFTYDKVGHQTATLTRTKTRSVDSYGKDLRQLTTSLSYDLKTTGGGGFGSEPPYTNFSTTLTYTPLANWKMSTYRAEISYTLDGVTQATKIVDLNPGSQNTGLTVDMGKKYHTQSGSTYIPKVMTITGVKIIGSLDGQANELVAGATTITKDTPYNSPSIKKLVWRKPVDGGDTPVFRYKLSSATTWSTASVSALGAYWSVNMSIFGSGLYDYEMTFSRSGSVYGRARGTVDTLATTDSFETPNVGSQDVAQPADATWSFFSGYAGISGKGSAYTSSAPPAPSGSQVAFLSYLGSISRTVNLRPNSVIRFSATQRNEESNWPQKLSVLINGVEQTIYSDNVALGTVAVPPKGSYQTYTVKLGAQYSGNYTLTIQGLVPYEVLPTMSTAFIDNITVNDTVTVLETSGDDTDSIVSYQMGVQQETAAYNAFGEITDKGLLAPGASLSAATIAHYDYDQAGRIWRSKENGVSTLSYYSALGTLGAQVKSATLDLGAATIDGQTVDGGAAFADKIGLTTTDNLSNYQRTYIWSNRLGQATRQQQAGYAISTRETIASNSFYAADQMSVSGAGQVSDVRGFSQIYYTYSDGVHLQWDSVRSAFPNDVTIDKIKVEYTATYNGTPLPYTSEELDPDATSYQKALKTELSSYHSNPSSGYTVSGIKVYVKLAGQSTFEAVPTRSQSTPTRRLSFNRPAGVDRALFRYRTSASAPWSQLFVDVTPDGSRFFIDLTARAGLASSTAYSFQLFYYEENVDVPSDPNSTEVILRACQSACGSFTPGNATPCTPLGIPVSETILPVTWQTTDRWGNVTRSENAAHQITDNVYNDNNQLTESRSAETTVVAATGVGDQATTTRERLISKTFYDQLGRRIGMQDAENVRAGQNLLQRAWTYDNSGNMISELDAEAGNNYTLHYYNAFGEKIRTTDPLYAEDANRAVNFSYDSYGRLIKRAHASGTTESYRYDAMGNRIETSNWLDDLGRQRLTMQQEFDAFGRVVRSSQHHYIGFQDTQAYAARTRYDYTALSHAIGVSVRGSGTETNFEYDLFGNKIREYNGAGDSMTWKFSANNQQEEHVDLAGVKTSYTYFNDGTLKQQKNNRSDGPIQNLSYAYDHAGHANQITDATTGSIQKFTYDILGRQVSSHFNDTVTTTSTRTEYDELGRLSRVVSGDGAFVDYSYDANGNRRRTRLRYRDPANAASYLGRDYWYRYDKSNRMTFAQGAFKDGSIQSIGREIEQTYTYGGHSSGGSYYMVQTRETQRAQGISLQYDAAGQRTNAFSLTTDNVWQYERYAYDSDGRLGEVKRYMDDNNTQDNETTITNKLRSFSSRAYDGANRVVALYSYKTSGDSRGKLDTYRKNTFDGAGQTVQQLIYSSKDTDTQSDDTVSAKIVWNMEASGVARSYTIRSYEGDGYVNTYTYDYRKFDTYRESRVSLSSTVMYANQTDETYDHNGNLVSVNDSRDNKLDRDMSYDLTGHILRKVSNGKTQNYLYGEGAQRASYGNLDSIDVDEGYTPIADTSIGTTPGSYTVVGSETLQDIAVNTWGDARLWYLIADANGLNAGATLSAGQTLTIPNRVANTHNAFDVAKPYNPDAIIGDLTPEAVMPPPPRMKCRAMAQAIGAIVAIVVAVVVMVVASIYTQSPEAAAAAGGAAGGAAGSMASQHSLRMLNGQYDWGKHFTHNYGKGPQRTSQFFDPYAYGEETDIDYEQVAVSTVAGAAGGAAGGYFGGIAGAMASAAVSYATSYTLNRVLGNDPHFSWRSLGASVTIAAMGAAMGGAKWTGTPPTTMTINTSFDWSKAVVQMLSSLGKSVISYGIHEAFEVEEPWSWGNVAGEAIGGALQSGFTTTTEQQGQTGQSIAIDEVIDNQLIDSMPSDIPGGRDHVNIAWPESLPDDYNFNPLDRGREISAPGGDSISAKRWSTEIENDRLLSRFKLPATVIDGPLITALHFSEGNANGYRSEEYGPFSAQDVSAFNAIFKNSGVDGSDPKATALLVKRGATLDQIFSSLTDSLGNFVYTKDPASLLPDSFDESNRADASVLVNIKPYKETIYGRIQFTANNDAELQRLTSLGQFYREKGIQAGASDINLGINLTDRGSRYLEQARTRYSENIDKLRDGGYLPKRDVTNAWLSTGTKLAFNLTVGSMFFWGAGRVVSLVRPAPAATMAGRTAPYSAVPEGYMGSIQIDMRAAPAGSGLNAAGHPRNGPWFWRQVSRENPGLFDAANLARIRAGSSPVVNDTWLASHPQHKAFQGNILVHHHIEQGAIATPLPQTVHQKWTKALHPN